MKTIRRAAIYGRVTADWQTMDNQVAALKELAERRGWEVVEVYIEDAIPAGTGRHKRPGFDQMLRHATTSNFDVVLARSIDLMGRSLRDLIETIEYLKEAGVDLYLDQQNIDTTTAAGKALFQVTRLFAEFHRSIIRQRVNSGPAAAAARGKRRGRLKIDSRTEWAICQAIASGKAISMIAAEFGVGSSTVQRIKAKMRRGG